LPAWDSGALFIERPGRRPEVLPWSRGTWTYETTDEDPVPMKGCLDLGRLYLN
jgi:hypothetical protein